MRFGERVIKGPNVVVVAIPRGDGDLIFKAQAIMDYGEFHRLLPRPKAPTVMRKGGVMGEDPTDENYKVQILEWSRARTNWMILKSLEATPGLHWDLVKIDDPNTWGKVDQEFTEAGFVNAETNKIIEAVFEANGLDEDKMEQARQRFLALEQAQNQLEASQAEERKNTQSGGPANASA